MRSARSAAKSSALRDELEKSIAAKIGRAPISLLSYFCFFFSLEISSVTLSSYSIFFLSSSVYV